MGAKQRKFLICNCEKTMSLDGGALGEALGSKAIGVHTHLCRSELPTFEKALQSGEHLCVACTQEAPLFSEIATEAGQPEPLYVNIRENAGWTGSRKSSVAKIAALLAAAQLEPVPVRTRAVASDGLCLVYGSGQTALDTAQLLNRQLSVTLLLDDSEDIVLPFVLDIPVFKGRLRSATGTLGAFEVTIDGYAAMLPSSRRQLEFAMARDGAKSNCSVIVDLSGADPLFSQHEMRDGYFRAEPGDPAAIARVLYDAGDYVGEFEKPIYVTHLPDICAHSRSQKTGCTKCIDNCPPGAITPDGDVVMIDIAICGGCGNCAAHCPTGAAQYQYPQRPDFIKRLQVLATTYHEAGGDKPVLLFHDGQHGTALIGAMARFGRGLPVNVIPVEIHAVTSVGHDAMIAALAAGFSAIMFLPDPRKSEEMAALEAEIDLTEAILGGLGAGTERIRIIAESDPDLAETRLWDMKHQAVIAKSTFTPTASKRETARAAMGLLANAAKDAPEFIELPPHSPYGVVKVDTDACTLCLACVSACPADALRDTPEKPELRFVESACVQCGICRATCPESAITLEQRANLSPSAMQPVTLCSDEPAECSRCGKPFASQKTIRRISEQLGGKHWMFETDERIALLAMCDSCRLEVLAEKTGDPFAMAERPRIRTTDDYIEAEKGGMSVDDFINKD